MEATNELQSDRNRDVERGDCLAWMEQHLDLEFHNMIAYPPNSDILPVSTRTKSMWLPGLTQ